MSIPFLALAPHTPRVVDVYYQPVLFPCVVSPSTCVDCYIYDPYEEQPRWENLEGQASITPIPIYGDLGFEAYANES